MKEDDEINRNNPKELPIHERGLEIYEVVKTITDLLLEDNEMLIQSTRR